MNSSLLERARAFLHAQRKKKIWYRLTTSMAAVVVFITTYMLILPAITMERDAVCGLEEHTHIEECYAESGELICDKTVHKHTDACYEQQDVILENAEDDAAAASSGTGSAGASDSLLLEAVEEVDDPGLASVEAESETASEAATEKETAEETEIVNYICGMEEHRHTDACYAENEAGERMIVCGKKEHTHGAECVGAEIETETEAETEAGTASVTETEIATEAGTEAETEAVAETETETETEAVAETETEIGTETATETETETEIGTETATETGTETAVESETDTEAATETETEAVTGTETETETEIETETENGTGLETATELTTEMDSETASEAESETEVETETEIATETEMETAAELSAEAADDGIMAVADLLTETHSDFAAEAGNAENAAPAESDTFDIRNYITDVVAKKKVGGKWVPTNDFVDGDSMNLRINYTIPADTVTDSSISYTFPEGMTISETDIYGSLKDIPITQNGTVVGHAHIEKAGGTYKVVINFNKAGSTLSAGEAAFNAKESFSGNFQIEAEVSAGENSTDRILDFGGSSGKVTIKHKETGTEVTDKKDLNISKDGVVSSVNDDGTITMTYTVIVYTTYGSDGKIKIWDELQLQQIKHGGYVEDSFKLEKFDASGNGTEIDAEKIFGTFGGDVSH